MKHLPHGSPLADSPIVESIADGVFTVDEDFRITSFNRAAESITGYPRERVLGRRCMDVFRASVCGKNCGLRRALVENRPVMMRSIYITDASGHRIPVCISAGVLRDHDGRPLGAVETFRDLSKIQTVRPDRPGETVPRIVGASPAMQRVFELIPCVAETDSTVLVEGESGTGKELVARAIHDLSGRREGPMVVVNCAALPDTLLESELFGHKAGAFTDARHDHPGRFQLADGGTIFLDEIGDVSSALQTRLLRVLQERVVEPLGGTRPVPVDVRVVSATHHDLQQRVADGAFRKDLYYRLNVIKISVPPLRDRLDDVPLLVDTFLARLNEAPGRDVDGVAPEVMEILMDHDYPGNVRELQNILEHAVVLNPRGLVRPRHLPPELRSRDGAHSSPSQDPITLLRRRRIEDALRRHEGNRRAAAEELGIHPTTLWRQARRLGLRLPERDGRSSAHS